MTRQSEPIHIPVLLEETLEGLRPRPGALIVDGTLGLGGHAAALLDRLAPDGRVIGFEWDREAAELARERLAPYGERVRVVPASYAEIVDRLTEFGIGQVDGVLVDLGVSSLQLDRGERGFSFRVDAPLDMRMNREQRRTAADILSSASEEELADILYHYGEERQARRIARVICESRKNTPLRTTGQLADLVAGAIPRRFHPRRIHVATRTFQALRIAVNRELDNLVRLLHDAPDVLAPGARFCVISFHSLEDRIVKRAFHDDPRLTPVNRRPIEADPAERDRNPRTRSARLRIAERVRDLEKVEGTAEFVLGVEGPRTQQ